MLSKKTKYGLKAMVHLAKRENEGYVLISEISEKESIPRKFLENILLELKSRGFINSKKGKGGGYYLMKPAKEISIASMIRVLDGPIALLPCVSLNYYEKCSDCVDEESCGLHRVMIEVRDNTLKILEGKSLYDLTEPESKLV